MLVDIVLCVSFINFADLNITNESEGFTLSPHLFQPPHTHERTHTHMHLHAHSSIMHARAHTLLFVLALVHRKWWRRVTDCTEVRKVGTPHALKQSTVEPVLGDHPFCPAKAVSQDRWSLIAGRTNIMFYRCVHF